MDYFVVNSGCAVLAFLLVTAFALGLLTPRKKNTPELTLQDSPVQAAPAYAPIRHPALEAVSPHGCAHASAPKLELSASDVFEQDYANYEGFAVIRNGQDVRDMFGSTVSTKTLENAARKYSGIDWQLHLHSPMRSLVYQRHAPDKWVLVKVGDGFA